MADYIVTIDRRFQGIPEIALGGYVGGLLAGTSVSGEVSLRRPVPLAKALRLERGEDGTATLFDGVEKLAAWKPGSVALDVPFAISVEEALEAEARSLQLSPSLEHPFPGCLVCGSARSRGDGLRLFAGPVSGVAAVAASWTPVKTHAGADGAVRPELVWAALDCPTIMAHVFAAPPDSSESVVTARFAVARRGPVRAGEPHVVMGWDAGVDGRARIGGGAVLSAKGEVLAIARHALVPAQWGVRLGLDSWRRG